MNDCSTYAPMHMAAEDQETNWISKPGSIWSRHASGIIDINELFTYVLYSSFGFDPIKGQLDLSSFVYYVHNRYARVLSHTKGIETST